MRVVVFPESVCSEPIPMLFQFLQNYQMQVLEDPDAGTEALLMNNKTEGVRKPLICQWHAMYAAPSKLACLVVCRVSAQGPLVHEECSVQNQQPVRATHSLLPLAGEDEDEDSLP